MVQHLAQNEIAAAVDDLAERAGMSSARSNGAARNWQEAAPPM